MIRQLSIFAENAKGTLKTITQVLADANVNMNTLITNDSAEFGIIRMLVSDPDRAEACIKAAGFMCRVDWVLAVEISDDAGSLNSLLETLLKGNIDIDYVYVTYSNLSKLPVVIMRTQDMGEVEEFLTARGYSPVERIADNP